MAENADKKRPVKEGEIVSCQLRPKMRKGKKFGRRRVRENSNPDNGLAYLIEDVMEKSEVVLAVQSITDKLQGIAEDLSTVEAKEVMPVLDSISSAFGPEISRKFNQVTTEKIRQLITAIQEAKSAIDVEIMRMKKGIEGGDMSDMGMDSDMDMDSDVDTAPDVDAEPEEPDEMPAGKNPRMDIPPVDTEGNKEDDDLGFAGRARKESARPRGKKLNEWGNSGKKYEAVDFYDEGWAVVRVSDNTRVENTKAKPKKMTEKQARAAAKKWNEKLKEDFLDARENPKPAIDQHPHKSENFAINVHNLGVFHGKAGMLAKNIEKMIDDEPLNGNERKSLANVLSHMAMVGPDATHWTDPEQKLTTALHAADIWDTKQPAVAKVVVKLRQLAHFLSMHHEQLIESSIKMLKESKNPDALVLHTFRRKFTEGKDAQMAAIRTARTFAIDVDDVVSIVKESVKKKVVKEFKMNTPKSAKGMFDGMSISELEARRDSNKKKIAAAKKDGKSHAKLTKDLERVNFAIRARKSKGGGGWSHKVTEEETLQHGAPIFPVGAGAKNMANIPTNQNAATNNVPNPGAVQPSSRPVGNPNFNPSTRKPLTPGERRSMQADQIGPAPATSAKITRGTTQSGVQDPMTSKMFNKPWQKPDDPMVPPGEVDAGGKAPPSKKAGNAPLQPVTKRA